MNILKLTPAQKIFVLIALFFLFGALNACAPLPEGAGSGAAGVSDATEAPSEDEAVPTEPNAPAEPEVAESANTPIPGTSGRIIYVSDRDGQMNLYVMSHDGAEQPRLTIADSDDKTPRLSPDGTRLAFVSTVDNNMDIYVLDLATGNVARVTDAPQRDSAPAWSADSSMLAFESFRDGNLEIYVANADGSNQRRLTDDPAGDTEPVWSPVSNEIAFTSDRSGNSNIFLLDLNGGVLPITTGNARDFDHSWSPNGNTIAFKTSASGELSNVCLMNRFDFTQRCLTTIPSEYGKPVWSPDGNFLAANARQTNGYGIDVFNLADDSVTYLFSPEADPRGAPPAWSPEGLRLVFQAKTPDGNMDLYTVLTLTNEFTRLTDSSGYDGEPVWAKQ